MHGHAQHQPKAAQAAAAPQATSAGAELRAAVLAVLRAVAVGREGLHMDAIVQKAGARAAEVKAVVAELVDDGNLHSTIAEEHFAAVWERIRLPSTMCSQASTHLTPTSLLGHAKHQAAQQAGVNVDSTLLRVKALREFNEQQSR